MVKALVLGGGGARGAYQVGMLDVLVNEHGLDFKIIRGVSIGALNAAFIAQTSTKPNSLEQLKLSVAELLRIWKEEIQGNRSVFEERIGGFFGLALGADSLLDNEPLWKLMKKHIDADKMRQSGRDFSVGVVDLVSGGFSERSPTNSQVFLKDILASAAIPVVFPPVRRKADEQVLVDGGVREITPLSSALRAKPSEVYVLMTSRAVKTRSGSLPRNTVFPGDYDEWEDNLIGTRVSGFDVLKRTLEILTDEIYLDDIRGVLAWNAVLKGAEELGKTIKGQNTSSVIQNAALKFEKVLSAAKKRHVPIHVIAPQEWYGKVNSSTAFDPTLINRAIEHGREVARDRSKWLWP